MDPESFFKGFFGPGNGLRWGEIPQDFSSWLQPWIERVENYRFPIFLPRWTDDRVMVWYAGAASFAAAAELQELITSFIGPSYAVFTGRLAVLQPNDSVDQAAAEYLGSSIYKFVVPNRADAPAIRIGLDRLRTLLDVRPVDQRQLPRPVGRVLRDFELSLVAGDDKLSQHLIDEMRTRGHLNAANLSFLEVVRMAELADWDGVLTHPNLPRLVEMRRPTRVTTALAEAVYRRFLVPYEESADVPGAVAEMRNAILPKYGPLFEGMAVVGPYATRLLLLFCLAGESVSGGAARQLRAVLPATPDRFVRMLAVELDARFRPESPTPTDAVEEAQAAVAAGQMQLAIAALGTAAPSIRRAALMVHCAYELNTLEHASIAAAAVDALSPNDLALLPQTRQFQQMLAEVREAVDKERRGQQSPTRWTEWFDRVATDPECHPYALRWAQGGADEWDVVEFDDAEVVESIATRLGHGTDAVVGIQGEALPYFLRALAAVPHVHIRRLHLQVLDTLLYRGARSRAELQVILEILDLTLGDLDHTDYRRVVGDLADIWSEVQAPASLEWAIQALDVLIAQPCRDLAARQGFALSIFATASVHLRRLDAAVRLTLNDIGRDLELPAELLLPAVSEEADQDPMLLLRGQRVALYTLTEGAGLRARDRLAYWTGRRVQVLSDKVCTDSLRAAARAADLFVMVTRSAKHPATDCIKANRPEDKGLVITSGKGSSSIVYALRAFLGHGTSVSP